MAFAFVQAAHNGSAASAASVAATVSAVNTANMVTGQVTWGSGTTTDLSSITDNGTGGTYVIKRRIADSTNGQSGADFYGYGWSAGPTTITANFSPDQVYRGISVMEFSGQASGDPIDGTNEQGQLQTNPGAGTDACKAGSGNLTPSANNYLVWGGSVCAGATATGSSEYNAGTNFTEPANAENLTDISVDSEYWIQTTATATDALFTLTANTAVSHLTFLMIFKVAGAVATIPNKIVNINQAVKRAGSY